MHARWLPVLMLCLGCSSSSSGVFDDPAAREEAITWRASVASDDPRQAAVALRAFTEDAGGYVSASEERGDRTHLRLRVPSAALPSLRGRLIELDPELSLSEQAEDVTEAHADTAARLRNQRATEVRLLALLDERTASLADVLAAERELARVREQIESLETEERALVHRVTFADVELTVLARSPSFTDAPLDAVASAFRAGCGATLRIVLGAAVIGSALLPSLTLLVLLVWLARALYRRASRYPDGRAPRPS